MMRPLLLLLAGVALAYPQDSAGLVKQGEQVFAKTCATGYCHGARGASGGAPRLAARGFNQAYIMGVIVRGIPNTGMQSFAGRLPHADLAAVIAYVAALNGVANPASGLGGPAATGSTESQLTGDAAHGALLFREACAGSGAAPPATKSAVTESPSPARSRKCPLRLTLSKRSRRPM